LNGRTHAKEAAVGVLEVHDCGPVIGLVFLELASRASGSFGDINARIHADIEAGQRVGL